jgi:hypothetical protein
MSRVVTALLAATVSGAVLASCGTSGGPQALPSRAPVAVATTPAPATTSAVPPVLPATSSGFPGDYAVPCAGRPDLQAVLAVLRSARVLPDAAAATASTGPLCSGTWQYTAVDVSGAGLLQVVTRGEPGTLQLVAAGTDICTATVRSQAPAGIRTVARC